LYVVADACEPSPQGRNRTADTDSRPHIITNPRDWQHNYPSGKSVGWVERSEPHHSSAEFSLLRLAPLVPIRTRLRDRSVVRQKEKPKGGTLILADLR
jgi:hypothetical protein